MERLTRRFWDAGKILRFAGLKSFYPPRPNNLVETGREEMTSDMEERSRQMEKMVQVKQIKVEEKKFK